MKTHSFFILFLICLYPISGLHAQSCDCAGDSDGNTVITASDLTALLGSMTCSMPEYDPCNDLNNDGVVDIRDVMTFENLWSSQCSNQDLIEPLPSGFTGLHVVEYLDYSEDLIGSAFGPEPGSRVYRIYAHFENPEEDVVGLYGYEGAPFIIEHTAPFFVYEGAGIHNPANSNSSLISEFVPELTVRSYFTAGVPEDEFPADDYLQLFTLCNPTNEFNENLSTQNDSYNSQEDGFYVGRLLFEVYDELITENESYKLVAQFTTAGDFELQTNIATRFYGSDRNIKNTYHEGMMASSGSLDVFGCTDPLASNYNPDATLDVGCVFTGPDLDGDGMVSMSDVLILLSEYGCSEDCGAADLNDDGLVNAADLIFLLAEL